MDTGDKVVVHGGGMMAAAIRAAEGLAGAVFAAGVSNSAELDCLQYAREENELRSFIGDNFDRQIIYFSSYIAKDGASRYAQHKRQMERLIAESARDFLVLRLPQVVGRATNKTLISYFVNAAKTRQAIAVQRDAFRSLVDVADVGRILSLFIAKKDVAREVIAVGPPKPLRVLEIVESIEAILEVKMDYTLVEGGERQSADLSRMSQLLDSTDPLFGDDYQHYVLKKYVSKLFSERFDQ